MGCTNYTNFFSTAKSELETQNLTSDPTQETPAHEQPDLTRTSTDAGEHIFTLRRVFKIAAGLHYKAKGSHKFLLEYRSKGTIPKGLQHRVSCIAAAKARTDITHQFDHIKSEAERLVLDIIIEHYTVIINSTFEEVEKLPPT